MISLKGICLKLIIFLICNFLFLQIGYTRIIPDCEFLANIVEEKFDLPPDVLASISNVEAGRILPNGNKKGWPWTVNHAGEGLFFENSSEAINYVKEALIIGDLNLDVGCMQISLKWHSENFKTLDEAFDPKINILYAAKFLKKLYNVHGSWDDAIKHYHSSDPNKNIKYHQKVLTAWKSKGKDSKNVNLLMNKIINANLIVPQAKPKSSLPETLSEIKDENTLLNNQDFGLEVNQILVSNSNQNNTETLIKNSRPLFINKRWELVLEFRKQFQTN